MTDPAPVPTTPSQDADAAELADRLAQQRDLYQQLKALSDQQGQLIAAGQAEPLLAVLSQRQSIIEQISQLNEQLVPLRQRWPEKAVHLDEAQRQRINTLLEEVEAMLEAIIRQDDQHRQQLYAAKEQITQKLEHASVAGRAMNAYQPAATATAAPARFTDRRG